MPTPSEPGRAAPIALNVCAIETAVALVAAIGAAIPGGCHHLLVGWNAYHRIEPRRPEEAAAETILDRVAIRLGVPARHFVFSDRLSANAPGAHPLDFVTSFVPALAFNPPLHRLAEAARRGALAVLVSGDALYWDSTDTPEYQPGVLHLSPVAPDDALNAAGLPCLVIDQAGSGLSAHERLDAAAGLIAGGRFDQPLTAPPSDRRPSAPSGTTP